MKYDKAVKQYEKDVKQVRRGLIALMLADPDAGNAVTSLSSVHREVNMVAEFDHQFSLPLILKAPNPSTTHLRPAANTGDSANDSLRFALRLSSRRMRRQQRRQQRQQPASATCTSSSARRRSSRCSSPAAA